MKEIFTLPTIAYVSDLVAKATLIQSKLKEAEIDFQETVMAHLVLGCLGKAFEPFLQSTLANNEDLNLTVLRTKLPMIQALKNGPTPPDSLALKTNTNFVKKCTYCKKKGHTVKECHKKEKNRSTDNVKLVIGCAKNDDRR